MNTKVQKQYSEKGQLVKKFLHTKLGAFIGYHLGISGYNRIDIKVINPNGKVKVGHSYNARVNAGAALCAYLQCGTNVGSLTSPAYAKYIALSTSVLTPAAGDTTLSGETAATGMGRTTGTAGNYSAPAGLDDAASFTLSNTFTNSSGSTVTINSAAIFDASSSGNMYVEGNTASAFPVINGAMLQIIWTINL